MGVFSQSACLQYRYINEKKKQQQQKNPESSNIYEMELKIWVNGQQRMLCGVTDNTTCQEIIIALAHSMACTGRFLLIVYRREFERILSPMEYPARILQNWGEYVSEVKLGLQFIEKKKKRNSFRNHNLKLISRGDKFKSKMSLKRSSTFAGYTGNINVFCKENSPKFAGLKADSNCKSGIHLYSLKSACLPYPIYFHDLLLSSSTRNETWTTQFYHAHNNMNCHITFCNCKNQHIDVGQTDENDLGKNDYYDNNSHADQIFMEKNNTIKSPILDIEEYDLDRNYPDILCDFDKGEDHSKHRMDQRLTTLKNERSHLIKLVVCQLERMNTKEIQIDRINTEISSLEGKKKNQKYLEDISKGEAMDSQAQDASFQSQSAEWSEELCVAQKCESHVKVSIFDIRGKQEYILERLICMEQKEAELIKDIKEIELGKELEAEHISGSIQNMKKSLMLKHSECRQIENQLDDLNEDICKLEILLNERSIQIDELKRELRKQKEVINIDL